MNQEIRFCNCPDGARIAYALSGRGPPLVMSGTWLNHLEYQWHNLAWRPWLEHFSREYTQLPQLRSIGPEALVARLEEKRHLFTKAH